MKTSHILIALVLIAAVLLAGCGSKETAPLAVPADTQAGELVGLKDCEFQPVDSKTKFAAECGTLVVPENWDKTDSRLIALPVVRIPAAGPEEAEPVFFLNGGPGSPNMVWAPPDWILKKHDVVLVGYRGVEGSVKLDCPEVNRIVQSRQGKDAFSTKPEEIPAVKQCAEGFLKAGVDLSGYTIPGVVEDLETARAAFGYEKINLFSLSYGTRIAQIYAYMHPNSLHRLVLIGVNTPGHFIWRPADFDKIIKHISDLCAMDVSCSSRTSDFAQTMYDVNHNMPTRWLFFNIDPSTIRLGAHGMFFRNTDMPLIFDAYLAAGKGDPSGFAMLNLAGSLMPFDPVLGDLFNKAATVDLEKYEGIENVSLGNSIMGAPMSEATWPMAAQWPSEMIRKDLREFQEADVDMLLVNGTVDFSTPPDAVDEAKSYFHKAQSVILPEFSHVHDVLEQQPEAFERLITTYYDTGVADDSLYVYQPLSFEPGMSLTTAARLLVAAMIIIPALIVWGVVAVVRRIQRRRNAHR
jgi:pimeloyl-ACP methyl ester carboxylesterase